MAEIATEDGNREEEVEQPASEESQPIEGQLGEEGEMTGNEEQTNNELEASAEKSASQTNLESDSDTEDEEEEEVVTNSSSSASSSTHLNQTAPQIQTGLAEPLLSASHTSPSALPAGGLNIISGITVTESVVPPGTPPSPSRCISVSSPGRGRKIFMVTRVESPLEQHQLQLQPGTSAPPSQPEEASNKPVDVNTPMTQQTQPPCSSQTPTQTELTKDDAKERSAASSTDFKGSLQSPTQTHTLQSQSVSQCTKDMTTSTLDPEERNISQHAATLPSESSSVQLIVEVTEDTKTPQHRPICVEETKEGECKDGEGSREDREQTLSIDIIEKDSNELEKLSQTQTSVHAVEMQQPLASTHNQLQNELASAAEETQSLNQTEEETQALEDLQDNFLENEKSTPTVNSQEDPKQQTEADHQGGEAVLSVETDQQASSVIQCMAQESNPTPEDLSPDPASPTSISPVEVEHSSNDSSVDEECLAKAPEEVVGSALPNGLKPEFTLHLLDTESPKSGSCVMEHGECLHLNI